MRELAQALGREPTNEEVGEKMGVPTARVVEILTLTQGTVSFETPLGDDGESTLGDRIEDHVTEGPEEEAAKENLHEKMSGALDSLGERERLVLRLIFGFEEGSAWTLEDVGRRFGVTRERVRQIEPKALRLLRQPSHARALMGFYRLVPTMAHLKGTRTRRMGDGASSLRERSRSKTRARELPARSSRRVSTPRA